MYAEDALSFVRDAILKDVQYAQGAAVVMIFMMTMICLVAASYET